MTGYILRPYDPAFLSPTIQRLYEQNILTQLQAYEEQWSAGEYALHMAIYFVKRFESYDDTLKKVTCDQFFALVNRLGDIIDEVLFETEEEVYDGDPTLFTDLPKEEQDGLCALLLNMCLQTLWPAAFLPSPQEGWDAKRGARSEKKKRERPIIVCLCGSTRFGEAFRQANLEETLKGKIVLSIGCEWQSDQALGLTEKDKERLDYLHLEKIAMADEVLILNCGGYIGESTRRELEYALSLGKSIRFLEPCEEDHTR